MKQWAHLLGNSHPASQLSFPVDGLSAAGAFSPSSKSSIWDHGQVLVSHLPSFPFSLVLVSALKMAAQTSDLASQTRGRNTLCWPLAAGFSCTCGHLQGFWGSPATLRSSKDCAWSEISQPLVRWEQIKCRPLTPFTPLAAAVRLCYLQGKPEFSFWHDDKDQIFSPR